MNIMGYHIILIVKCIIKDKYVNCIDFLNPDDDYDPADHYEYEYNRKKPRYRVISDEEYDLLTKDEKCIPKSIEHLQDLYRDLDIGHSFYEYGFVKDKRNSNYKFNKKIKDTNDTNEFDIKIEIKPYNHEGNLSYDYERFVREILVPLTTKIIYCEIEHDDYNIDSTYYIDDELRDVKYISAVILPDKPEVQIGKRRPIKEKKPEVIDKLKVYPDIYDSPDETWPDELQFWWYHLDNRKRCQEIINNLRKYYLEDEYLMSVADWIEKHLQNEKVNFIWNC
jgi:hypothetical protein